MNGNYKSKIDKCVNRMDDIEEAQDDNVRVHDRKLKNLSDKI
jgi:hypothetical protein